MSGLRELAIAAGLEPEWVDVFGSVRPVQEETLRAALAALGLPAESAADIAASQAFLAQQAGELPPLLTALPGQFVALPGASGRGRITLESGATLDVTVAQGGISAPGECGYHALEIGSARVTLAVCPQRALLPAQLTGRQRSWGLAVQVYGLRRRGDAGLGDYRALRDFVGQAARLGAQAVAISPVHALFSADPQRFSPYAPSSRLMLNVLHATGMYEELPFEAEAELERAALIDWPQAARLRLAHLRRAFTHALADPAQMQELARFRAARGEALEFHARFEALHEEIFNRDPDRWHWRSWDAALRDPGSPAVAQFAQAHAQRVQFHAWLQFLADTGLAEAQAGARAGGMGIGLISDLAVGTDSGGSHAWSRQDEMMSGLSIGAPPDLLSRDGQDWGLVSFSPHGLRRRGYAGFIEMLRCSLRHAGGVRIDHAMGLHRLWVVPQGASPAEGVYLRQNRTDLLRLLALESHRHRAIVLAEDLGTVPEGFQPALQQHGILGLRVLLFEKEGDDFRPPAAWSAQAVAMTTTHDLPTVAGWWQGTDLAWRERLGLARDAAAEVAQRVRDRGLLWAQFQASGAALDAAPPLQDGACAANAAVVQIGRSACTLALLPMEDALALPDQPNLPGALREHPNWRRRLPAPAAELFEDPAVAARLAALDSARR